MQGLLLQINMTNTVAATTDTLNAAMTNMVAAQNPAPTEESFSLFTMVVKGGVMMIPLGLLLVVSIYVAIERLLATGRAGRKNPGLMSGLKDLIHNGNMDAAKALCKSQNSPEGAMLEKGISRIGQPLSEIREVMTEAAGIELNRLEKNLGVLNITGRIAPMFGFVGTIIGVIKIFYDISLAGTVEIEIISTGLYQKMITSASGLVVGVLAFIAYHWMNARIDKIAHRMEESKLGLMDILNEPTK